MMPAALPLTEAEREAALEFLDRRPVHNVIMSGWLMEYGVISPRHRGTFYRTLDADGRINGIALIGRHTFFEAASDRAVFSFADEARRHDKIKLFFGEEEKLVDFWYRYSTGREGRSEPRSELLVGRRSIPAAALADTPVRPAEVSQLEEVVAAHARMVHDETGADPLVEDEEGFRSRCRARIEAGKTWVAASPDGELIFKTEIAARTPKAVYIEGVWVHPMFRGRDIGKNCLEAVCRLVLDGTNTVCGFVDGADQRALSLYRRAGFEITHRFRKIYV